MTLTLHMKKENLTATTVKIEKPLYLEFKVLAIRRSLNLQKFVDKCVHLYVVENTFRDIVDAFTVPQLSTTGSFTLSI